MSRLVIIADDAAANRSILRHIIRDEYSVLEAENGRQTMELLESRGAQVSAVLLDIIMPVMDGFGVLKLMKADPVLSQIPVIVTTGSADTEAERRALALGANDFVGKPYDAEIIKRRLENLVRLRETSAAVNVLERDELTGLYNRRAFFSRAEGLIAARPEGHFVVSCLDIDNFKVINDRYGTTAGDAVLTHIADVCRSRADIPDALSCRIAADEFAVLYPAEYISSPRLEEIRARMSRPEGNMPPITISIGRYLINDRSLPVSAMYDRAAIAMSAVKGHYGEHSAMYDESMRASILRESEIVGYMNEALQGGQFETWLQPQYNHASGALIGAEALVRWRHPERGLMMPEEFIPMFERNGFIYELDKQMWEQACKLLREWLNAGLSPLPLSVNVSRSDMFHDDMTDVLSGLLGKYAIPVGLMRLEITETAFAKSPQSIISAVHRLVELGFTVEIDDFGSGYSSLNTLKDVPAQVIKLDMKFLDDSVPGGQTDRGGNILSSVVRMVKWLGVSLIAEGVETLEQAEYLKSIGCIYVQGYLYGKPMTVDEYERLASSGSGEGELQVLETVENLDNNSFWEPDSMDTLIFNSYVGAACIFEYHAGSIELLRANAKFARMLGGIAVQSLLALDVSRYMDDAGRSALSAAVIRSRETRDESAGELSLHDMPDGPALVCLRYALQVIASAGDRLLVYCTAEDITAQREDERRRMEAESAMQSVSAQLSAIMDSIENGVSAVTVSESGRISFIFANESYYTILGYTREEFDAELTDAMDIVHPEDRERTIKSLTEIVQNGGKRTYEYRCTRRDGAVIHLRCNSTIAYLEGVEGRVLLSVISDVTSEKETEERIRSLRENQERLMNDTPGGFVRMRRLPDGTIIPVFVNSGFCQLVNMSAAEIMENYRDDATWGVHPSDLDTVQDIIRQMNESGEAASGKYRLRRGPEGYIWVMIHGRMTMDENGGVFYNVYYADISEREKKELSEREMLSISLATIMADSHDLSFVKDSSLKYVYCSRPTAELAGFVKAEQLVGKTDSQVLDSRLAAQYEDLDHQVLATGKPVLDMSLPLPSKQGNMRYSTFSKYPMFDSFGNIIGIYGIGRDVTRERMAYAQLKLLADSVPGGLAMYEITPTRIRLQLCTDGFFALTGYTRDEYLRLTDRDPMCLVLPSDMLSFRKQVRALLSGADSFEQSYRAYHKSGVPRWITMRGTVMERQADRLIVNTVKLDVTEQHDAIESMRYRQEEYRLAIAHSGKLVYRYSHADDSIELPPNTAELFRLPPRVENMPQPVVESDDIDPDSVAEYRGFFDAIRRGDRTGSMTIRRRILSGEWRWFNARFSCVFDDYGKPISAIIVCEDVTQEREEHMADALNLRRFTAALGTVYPVVISLNLSRNTYQVISANARLSVLSAPEGSIDDLINTVAGRMEPEYAVQFRQKLRRDRLIDMFSASGDSMRMEFRQRTRDGDVRWMEMIIIRTENDFGSEVTGVVVSRYIDAQKAIEDKLKQAETDGMTGVLNKTAVERLITQRLATAPSDAPCALLIVDLDDLKGLNDSYGHSLGDSALRALARLLQSQFRQTDIVGRIGGDEFEAFLCDVTPARVSSMLTTFMRKLAAVRVGDSNELPIRSSVGVAMGSPGDSYEKLFKMADTALYYVKRSGKNDFIFYSPDMEGEAYEYQPPNRIDRWGIPTLNAQELEYLLQAVTAVYPMVVAADLVRNSYYMIQYDSFTAHRATDAGVYDDLLETTVAAVHASDRDAFRAAMNRDSLSAARDRDEKRVSVTAMRKGEDGVYRRLLTEAVFVGGDGEDAPVILMARETDR